MNLDAGNDVKVPCLDVPEGDTTAVSNSPCHWAGVPACNVAASMNPDQQETKETSSYRKSNFVLPVTFFDIPSNLSFLNECIPLTIKVVDCDKHPWYYKKYRRNSQSEPIEQNSEEMLHVSETMNNKDCVNIDLTDTKYDKFDKVNYSSKSSTNDRTKHDKNTTHKSSSTKKPRKKRTMKTDELKHMAMKKIDFSKIDFKRNKGLIGLKITHKTEVVENSQDVTGAVNGKTLEPMKISNKEVIEADIETIIINNDDHYMDGVDKALCEQGTTIIPVSQNNVKNASIGTGIKCPMKKSDFILQMSKKKLVKSHIKRIPKVKISSNNLKKIHKLDSEPTNKETSDIVGCQAIKPNNIIATVEKECLKKPQKKKKENTESSIPTKHTQQNKESNHNEKNDINIFGVQPNHQRQELHNLKTKVIQDLFRSPSPIFSCNNNKQNKGMVTNKSSLKYEMDQYQSKLMLNNVDSDKPHKSASESVSSVKEDSVNRALLLKDCLQPHNLDAICNNKRFNKNTLKITAVNIDKLRYTNGVQHQTIINQKNDSLKYGYELKKPAFSLQSERHNTVMKDQNDTVKNKKLITVITAVANDKPQKALNTISQAETLPTNTLGPLHYSPKTSYSHIRDSHNQIRISPEFHSVMEHLNQGVVRHHIPVQIQASKGLNHKKGNPRNLTGLFTSNRPTTPRPPNPANVFPYNMSHPINEFPYPHPHNQNNLQQNINWLRNVPPQHMGNINGPLWFSPYRLPPPMPPPPPPPPPPVADYPNAMQANVQAPNVKAFNHHSPALYPVSEVTAVNNINNLVNRTNPANDPVANNLGEIKSDTTPVSMAHSNLRNLAQTHVKTYQEPKINTTINEKVPDVKPVTSKTEMFQELQKESMKINSELFTNNTENQFQSQNTSYNQQIPVLVSNKKDNFGQEAYPNAGINRINMETNNIKSVPSFGADSKILYSKWKREQMHKGKKEDEAQKIITEEAEKPKYNCDSITDSEGGKNYMLSAPKKPPLNRPRAGPLCMKKKIVNSLAPHQASAQTQQISSPAPKSPPNKGYSPPILPIPTFQKSLEMLTQANDVIRQTNVDKDKCQSNPPKYLRNDNQVKNKPCQKRQMNRIEYFCMDKDAKSLKKITLQDYQNRVAKGDDKCIVLKKDSSCKRAKRNQSSEQDLGYDSDATVKL